MKRAANTWQAAGWALQHIGSDDIRHSLHISILVRWFVGAVWFVGAAWYAQENYLSEFSSETYVLHSILAASLMALNGYVYYRIRSGRPVSWHWALGLSILDLATITAALDIAGGFSNDFYVLYYPALAAFAVVFASFRLSFTCVTVTAAFYTVLSLYSGLDFESGQEKVLFIRIVTMYAVVMAVSLIFRLERSRRREAVQRERELQRERIELSQTIHDTIAQTAYMMGIGVETAIELAEGTSEELVAKLKATHALSKSTMWELRHPIDAGPIFEGRDLGRVLRSHASTFTTITSIPADVVQSGEEPQFSTVTKGLLFTIAHNAMTNAFRHSQASRVTISLAYEDDYLSVTVSDDGIGLPDNYAERGHGFKNMAADAERMGGNLEVTQSTEGQGTSVTCRVPRQSSRRL